MIDTVSTGVFGFFDLLKKELKLEYVFVDELPGCSFGPVGLPSPASTLSSLFLLQLDLICSFHP